MAASGRAQIARVDAGIRRLINRYVEDARGTIERELLARHGMQETPNLGESGAAAELAPDAIRREPDPKKASRGA